MCSCREQTR